jgi:hypothetical protein
MELDAVQGPHAEFPAASSNDTCPARPRLGNWPGLLDKSGASQGECSARPKSLARPGTERSDLAAVRVFQSQCRWDFAADEFLVGESHPDDGTGVCTGARLVGGSSLATSAALRGISLCI